jgi:hypothetical protein
MEPQLSQATRVPQLDITNSILYTIATLAVGFRSYTRSKIIRKVIAGDWWMLGAWVRHLILSRHPGVKVHTNLAFL